MTVRIEKTNSKLNVYSPYNKLFVNYARSANGKWNGAAWVFNVSAEQAIREQLLDIYGTDGDLDNTVKVRITANDNISEFGSIEYNCINIISAFGRDSGARVCEGVTLIKGGITSGGSRKNYTANAEKGTVLELRIPCSDAEEAVASASEKDEWKCEILENFDAQKLIEEKEKLLKRIAEIDAALNQ